MRNHQICSLGFHHALWRWHSLGVCMILFVIAANATVNLFFSAHVVLIRMLWGKNRGKQKAGGRRESKSNPAFKPEMSWVWLPVAVGLFTFLYFCLITSKFIYFQSEARSSEHLVWESHSAWVLSWWREFSCQPLTEFRWHILSGCRCMIEAPVQYI